VPFAPRAPPAQPPRRPPHTPADRSGNILRVVLTSQEQTQANTRTCGVVPQCRARSWNPLRPQAPWEKDCPNRSSGRWGRKDPLLLLPSPPACVSLPSRLPVGAGRS
jgi:hypothetical protein